ncbi:MAG TPA: ABC transporter permease [Gemmatimonadaceae bacterium]|jgi:predicted permease|nr:ABC transporter permease [Gemmatimonadaceae bacterium]
MTWFHAARARLRLLAPRAAEARIDDEIRFHIEMETERLVREHALDSDEARRRALATFGGVQQHRETLREGRGTAWLSGLSLDLKLGFRMLTKYPGLTVVGGLAMAFGIWFGAVTYHMFGLITSTKLPLPDGDRIVKILNWDAKANQEEGRVLYDYQLWRSARSVTDLGAYRDASVNVVGADRGARPAAAAEITAAAFRIAPERPLLGRVLAESDERAGAPPVVLLGHDVWANRFDRDPGIVGRTVQLGNGFATVVGVMPEGYGFPISHDLWLPLRTDVPGVEPLGGAGIKVFGRLAPGMTFETAQAELTALGRRLAAEHPTTHAQLRPHVLPYTKPDPDSGDMPQVKALTYSFIVALVMLVCSTVALLLFARAASRETELLVRSALGASRRRIVTQLFAEALVLAGVAAVAGLAAAQFALTRLGEPYLEMNYGRLPFWYEFNLSPATIIFALALAVVGAVVAGVMPARKVTRGLGTQLRARTAGGGGVSFGGVWTAVIVTQIALTVALPAVVMLVRSERERIAAYDFGFPAQEYLGVTLGIDGPAEETPTPERGALLGASVEAMRRRLEVEPGVAGVTFVDRLPGEYRPARRLEVVSLPGTPSSLVRTARIHPSYFEVLEAPMIAGRAFTNADVSPDARVVIVDQGFADRVMPGRNVIGHRVRLSSGPMLDSNVAQLPWHEIVGVVKELGMSDVGQRSRPAGVYLPFVPGNRGALSMIVQVQGDPLSIAPRVRELATRVDASLRVERMQRLDQVADDDLWFFGLWMRIIVGLTAVALLLSLAGIYAVLSYTVARRTREIGVRVALGASARRVITSIFRRPLTQVTLGVIAGSVLIGVGAIVAGNSRQFQGTEIGVLTFGDVALLGGYAIVMLGVCMLACVVPTVRALRVQPTEALRAE